jgi:hypothetical protein
MTEKRQTSQGYIVRILQHFATKLRNITNFVFFCDLVKKICDLVLKPVIFRFFSIEILGHIFTILLQCHWYISVYAHHSSLQNTDAQTYCSCLGQVSTYSLPLS